MAYYPKSIMPNVQKKNMSGGVGSINADDINRHNDELIAIERFLGIDQFASEVDENDIVSGKNDPKNIIGAIRKLVDSINTFVDGGVLTSSGYALDGQRIIFPETAHSTFLTKTPAPADKTIKVTSTIGFPDIGVISILNDVDTPNTIVDGSFVEWIKYAGKTSTEFIGCERGFLGTTVGKHSGTPALSGTFSGTLNKLDQCVKTPVGVQACNRRYPGWRYREMLSFQSFKLLGTFVEITRAIRRVPEFFDLSAEKLGEDYERIIEVATDDGILATRASDGKQILQSQDTEYVALKELTWTEAEAFVEELMFLIDDTSPIIISTVRDVGDWTVGNAPYIPVFQGRMSIDYTIAALTVKPTASTEPTVISVPSTTTTTPVVPPVVPTSASVASDVFNVSNFGIPNRLYANPFDPADQVVYVATQQNSVVPTSTAKVYKLNGQASAVFAGNGQACCGVADGTPATSNTIYAGGIAKFSSNPDVFTALSVLHRLAYVNVSNNLILLAGTGVPASSNSVVASQSPTVTAADIYDVAVEGSNVFYSEPTFRRIRMISSYNSSPVVTQLSFDFTSSSINTGNFVPTKIRGDNAGGLLVLSENFATTTGKTYLLRINLASHICSIVAGSGTYGSVATEGAANTISIAPVDFCTDSIGNIYISETTQIRKIDTSGNMTTISVNKNSSSDTYLRIAVNSANEFYYATLDRVVRVRYPWDSSSAEIVMRKTPIVVTPTVTTTLPPPPSVTTTPPAEAVINPATTPPTSLESIGLIQTADGRLFTRIKTDVDQSLTDQAAIQYKTFFVSSTRSSQQRDSI